MAGSAPGAEAAAASAGLGAPPNAALAGGTRPFGGSSSMSDDGGDGGAESGGGPSGGSATGASIDIGAIGGAAGGAAGGAVGCGAVSGCCAPSAGIDRSRVAPQLAHEAVALVPACEAGMLSESVARHCAHSKTKLRVALAAGGGRMPKPAAGGVACLAGRPAAAAADGGSARLAPPSPRPHTCATCLPAHASHAGLGRAASASMYWLYTRQSFRCSCGSHVDPG